MIFKLYLNFACLPIAVRPSSSTYIGLQIFHAMCTIMYNLQICCLAEDLSIAPSTYVVSFLSIIGLLFCIQQNKRMQNC